MSPLKLFEYLASSRIILASKMRAYSHILKNNYNAILIKNNKPERWSDSIKKIFFKPKKFSYLGNNAYKSVLHNTWNLRARKIITKIEFNA
jgi:glycosyltransferase involved in cell wall biosynthesis